MISSFQSIFSALVVLSINGARKAAGYYTNYPAEACARAKQGFRLVFLGHDMVQLPDAFAAMKREQPPA